MIAVLLGRRKNTDVQGSRPDEDGVEAGMMWLQAEEHQGLPGARDGFSPQSLLKEPTLLTHWVQISASRTVT